MEEAQDTEIFDDFDQQSNHNSFQEVEEDPSMNIEPASTSPTPVPQACKKS